MNGPNSGCAANLQRGILLRGQRRYKEASEFLGRAIEAAPDNSLAYAELALCYNDWGGRGNDALNAINHAIALDPANAQYHGLKGWILVCQNRYGAALHAANAGIELDPLNIMALNAQANAYTKLRKWKEAEASARRVLALNPNNAPALNLLAQALRLQGRGRESREVVAHILALLPNNAFGHMNAGYAAMEIGDHLRANEHFLTSLQMNPHSDLARKGLLHSLRARVWIYRWHFRYATFLRRPATFRRFLLFVAVIAGLGTLAGYLQSYHQGWGSWLGILWLIVVYMNLFSRLTGNIFLLADPVGRHALTRQEKTAACLFAVLLGCVLVILFQAQAWNILGVISAILALFAFSIYYPCIKDRPRRGSKPRAVATAISPE